MNDTSMHDMLWTDDIGILINNDKITDIWPSESNTLHENYNAMIRFMSLYTVMIALYKQNTIPFAMLFVFMIIFYLFYNFLYSNKQNDVDILHKVNNRMDQIRPNMIIGNKMNNEMKEYPSKHCKASTGSNPFMNPILGESMEDTYKPICDFETNKNIDNNFVSSLPQSEWDIYNKQNSQRQFYTIPNHTSYADQSEYAKWLYGNNSRMI